jgi:hypothetical protein
MLDVAAATASVLTRRGLVVSRGRRSSTALLVLVTDGSGPSVGLRLRSFVGGSKEDIMVAKDAELAQYDGAGMALIERCRVLGRCDYGLTTIRS